MKVPRLNLGTAYSPGRPRSVKKLEELQFDPLVEMVNLSRRITSELEIQEKRRSGALVELNHLGKKRGYREDQHIALLGQAQKTLSELMRYAYGRVPENGTQEAPKRAGRLSITLTQEGETFDIGEPDNFDDAEYVEEGS